MGKNAPFLALAMVVSGCIGDFATDTELRAKLASNQASAEVTGTDTPHRIEEARNGPDADATVAEPAPDVSDDVEVADADADVVDAIDDEFDTPDITEIEVAAEVTTVVPETVIDTVDVPDEVEAATEVAVEVTTVVPDADAVEETGLDGTDVQAEVPDADIAEADTVDAAEEVTAVVPDVDAVDADATDAQADVVDADTAEANDIATEVAVEVTAVMPDADAVEETGLDGTDAQAEVPDADVAEADTAEVAPEVVSDPCVAKNCNDGNACTEDLCAVKAGSALCINLPLTATVCSDGNACTIGDACTGGTCKAGSQKTCEDNNPCTSDSCSAETGDCAFSQKKPYLEDGFEYTAIDDASKNGWKFGGITDTVKQSWTITKAKEKLAKDGGVAGLGVQNASLNTTITATHLLPKLPPSGAVVKIFFTFYHPSGSEAYKIGWRALDSDGKEVAGDALAAPPNGTDKWDTVPIPVTAMALELFLTAGNQKGTTEVSVFDALQVADKACLK